MAEAGTGQRRIDYLSLEEIQPAPRNPKRHALDALGRSVERFGFVEPIVLDERTGRLVAGHGRVEHLLARKAAGDHPPEGIDAEDGRWRVPVIRGWASTDDAEAEAYLLASNRLTELGAWDAPMLADVFAAMDGALQGVTGFDDKDISDLLTKFKDVTYNPDPSYGGPDPAHAEASIDDRAELYAGKDVRSIVLDYNLEEYAKVVETAAKLRAKHGVTSNAELFLLLLEEAAA